MKEQVQLPPQFTYIPAVAIQRATLKHSWNKIAVATAAVPDITCGEARRIGYTGKLENDLALYRLKIRQGNSQPTVTLPGLYIIDKGVFLDYEEWRQAGGSD